MRQQKIVQLQRQVQPQRQVQTQRQVIKNQRIFDQKFNEQFANPIRVLHQLSPEHLIRIIEQYPDLTPYVINNKQLRDKLAYNPEVLTNMMEMAGINCNAIVNDKFRKLHTGEHLAHMLAKRPQLYSQLMRMGETSLLPKEQREELAQNPFNSQLRSKL